MNVSELYCLQLEHGLRKQAEAYCKSTGLTLNQYITGLIEKHQARLAFEYQSGADLDERPSAAKLRQIQRT